MKYFTKLLLAGACALSIQVASAEAEHESMFEKVGNVFHEYVVAPVKGFFTRMEGVDDEGNKVEDLAPLDGAEALKKAKDPNPPAVVGEDKNAHLTHDQFEKVIDSVSSEKKENHEVLPAAKEHKAVKDELQKQETLQDLKDGSQTLTDLTNAEKPEAKEPLKDEAEIAKKAEDNIKEKIVNSEQKAEVLK